MHRDVDTRCFVQVFRVVLTLVVLFKRLRLFDSLNTCCFVQVFRVVVTLVVLFKQLRLFDSLNTCCFVQVFRVVLTLVVLFKRLRLFVSLHLFCSSVQGRPYACYFIQAVKVVCELRRVENGVVMLE